MSQRRHDASRDANELEIVRALETVGATVQRLNESGCPDLLVGYGGADYLLEVKLPLGARGGSKDRILTDRQQEWWREWRGAEPNIVRTEEEALFVIGASPRG